MKSTLLLPIRLMLSSLALSLSLGSCDSDTTEPMPEAAATTTSFVLVDSMKVQPSYTDLYQQYQGKTYEVRSKDQVESFFVQEDEDLILYFRETSKEKEQPWVSFTFKNRTVQNLPPVISLSDEAMVCVQQGQSFKDGSAALSPGCVDVMKGDIALAYNPTTRVLSGSVTNLKFAVEYFVPDYAFPNRNGNIFKASGSSRNLNITFENVRTR